MLLFNSEANNMDCLKRTVDSCLNDILGWTNYNSLQINSRKSKIILFGSHDQDIEIFIGDSRVVVVDSHRCLGVILDNKLNFGYHIDHIHSIIYLNLLKLYSTSIYSPLCFRIRIARALMMPHMLYALKIISVKSEHNFHKFELILNMIVKFVYNVQSEMSIYPKLL